MADVPVMVQELTGSHYTAIQMLESAVGREHVNIQNGGLPHARYASLKNGTARAIAVMEPFISLGLKDGAHIIAASFYRGGEVISPDLTSEQRKTYYDAENEAVDLINADFYKYAAEKGTLFYTPGEQIKRVRPIWVCTGPVTYTGGASLANEIETLKRHVPVEDAFLTSTAPASLEVYRRNEYYKSEEEFLYAIAEAMRVEYETIVKSGVVLQIDDAWLVALWDRIGIQMGMAAFRKRSQIRIEALNHALRNVPEDRVRYHLCWGSWHGPHAYDIELKDVVDLMLEVKAQAYLIEGANARHEHEYAVWDSVRLPEGKILIPGVVTHSTDIVEHPEVVSQRIQRFAERVGKENVIAGCDCGFGGRSHPQIAWAKLKALADGAALASHAMF
jgi:5-methyltetrahydropteroyltriglutamate--homocysteine methyltransferase